MSDLDALRDALRDRDPETLIGPALLLLTRRAKEPAAPSECLREHLLALALHPRIAPEVRLSAGAIALELRLQPALTSP